LKSETQRLWYVMRAGAVRGPFPTAAVAQDLATGRLPADVQLSTDRVSWSQATDLDAFSDLLQPGQSDDGWAEERRRALRRWADERDGQERRAVAGEGGARRTGAERRQGEGGARAAPLRVPEPKSRGWLVVASLIALLAGLILLALLGPGGAPEIKLLK
jgi:hypothetical protein